MLWDMHLVLEWAMQWVVELGKQLVLEWAMQWVLESEKLREKGRE